MQAATILLAARPLAGLLGQLDEQIDPGGDRDLVERSSSQPLERDRWLRKAFA